MHTKENEGAFNYKDLYIPADDALRADCGFFMKKTITILSAPIDSHHDTEGHQVEPPLAICRT